MEKLANILLDKRMSLPIVYDEARFEKIVERVLDNYLMLLKEYSDNDDIITKVNIFKNSIKEMYSQYFLGHQNSAYNAFVKAFKELFSTIYTSYLPDESFYRARINSGNVDYGNDEMFHIKYDLRGKVATQRFSFPGLPCLYLGESSYVCWLELNRPSFDNFQVAMIRRSVDLKNKVLNLSMHPRNYYKDLINGKEEFKLREYLLWWPVIALSTIAVRNENDSFKPEYVFPQYILQYILENEIKNVIGIKYMSTKAGKVSSKQYEADHRTYTNYVFPIRSAKDDKGFCPGLRTDFKIVRNYSGRELQIITDSIRKSGVKWQELGDKKPTSPLEETEIYTTNGSSFKYGKSIFRRIEIALENGDNCNFYDDGDLILEPISNDEIDRISNDVMQ